MGDMEVGTLAVLFVIIQILFYGVPEIILGAAGYIALRKGYVKSGGTIIASAVLALLNSAASSVALRFFAIEYYQGFLIYLIQGIGVLSAGLLCGAVLGLALSIPRAARQKLDSAT